MTYDECTDDEISTTEYQSSSDDEYINTKEKRGDGLLRRYQRGIRLLDHPHFLLLYVPDDGTTMRLVKPSEDPYHRERIIQMVDGKDLLLPYYALSHLWGTSKANPHLWEEIGEYVMDENGEPAVPVSMRPEKRKSCLYCLKITLTVTGGSMCYVHVRTRLWVLWATLMLAATYATLWSIVKLT